jgi:hypothetical protein
VSWSFYLDLQSTQARGKTLEQKPVPLFKNMANTVRTAAEGKNPRAEKQEMGTKNA